MTKNKENKQGVARKALWILVALASIKSIFTDTGFDNSYTVAMSYRHLSGDQMFKYMWEPHQTSIYLNDVLMALYHLVMPDYTGVMIYLQICGTLLMAGTACVLYSLVKKISTKEIASLAACFFFIFRVKQSPFMDYANLMICISVIMLWSIFSYLEEEKTVFVILTGILLIMQILAYPSSIITYVPIVIILLAKSKKKWKAILQFTITCLVLGMSYVSYFAVKLGMDNFIRNLRCMMAADSHSTGERFSAGGYFYQQNYVLIWILSAAGLALLIKGIFKLVKKEQEFLPWFGAFLFTLEVVMLLTMKRTGIDWTCISYSVPSLLLVLSIMFGYKEMSDKEKLLWLIGVSLSIASFISALLLSDLSILSMQAYLVLAGSVSIIPIVRYRKKEWLFIFFIIGLVTFQRGTVVWGYGNLSGKMTLFEQNSLIRSGPSVGIVCDDNTNKNITYDREDHNIVMDENDSVLFINLPICDSLEFMLTDAKISNCSVIDTPYYEEGMLEYYRLYPEKKPTIVAVRCWDGVIQVNDSPVLEWVEENYTPVSEGRFWKYYR